jgi:hypothetical protein
MSAQSINKSYRMMQFFGTLVFIIGLSGVCGYATGNEHLYRWINDAGMAFNTTIAFVCVGLSFYFVARWLLSLDNRVDTLEKTIGQV